MVIVLVGATMTEVKIERFEMSSMRVFGSFSYITNFFRGVLIQHKKEKKTFLFSKVDSPLNIYVFFSNSLLLFFFLKK